MRRALREAPDGCQSDSLDAPGHHRLVVVDPAEIRPAVLGEIHLCQERFKQVVLRIHRDGYVAILWLPPGLGESTCLQGNDHRF